MQTCCLRGHHADLSLLQEAGAELASGSCASSAEVRYQRDRQVGDQDRQDGTHAHILTHQLLGRSSAELRGGRGGQRAGVRRHSGP
jgi:hypothetical protein